MKTESCYLLNFSFPYFWPGEHLCLENFIDIYNSKIKGLSTKTLSVITYILQTTLQQKPLSIFVISHLSKASNISKKNRFLGRFTSLIIYSKSQSIQIRFSDMQNDLKVLTRTVYNKNFLFNSGIKNALNYFHVNNFPLLTFEQ